MREKQISLTIKVYDTPDELRVDERELLEEARQALDKSHSPYSNFRVGSAALLSNGATLSAANQENASYPVCVCAEVALLSACSSVYPGLAISKIAITTRAAAHPSDSPKAPCGQCRQALLEFEARGGKNIEIILAGDTGPVYKLGSVKDLLPLHFSGSDL
ncbi:MAG: cytidine deaminase [Bacteroidetes bacterium]|nr:cytidine deaminase [Bacteroidota bacterium]